MGIVLVDEGLGEAMVLKIIRKSFPFPEVDFPEVR